MATHTENLPTARGPERARTYDRPERGRGEIVHDDTRKKNVTTFLLVLAVLIVAALILALIF